MSKTLPPNPSLENLKKQAKALLKACRDGDPEALRSVRTAIGRTRKPGKPKDTELTLREVQSALAREYGFETWKALAEAAEAMQRFQNPTPEDKILTHDEIEGLLSQAGPGFAAEALMDVIKAHYVYAISLKIAGDRRGAVRELRQCQHQAWGVWPDQKTKAGVEALLAELEQDPE